MKFARILTLAVVAVCSTAATAAAQKNKTTCGPDVHLRVSVTGTQGATNGMAYVSDGVGEYISGTGRVEARFQVENCTHDFTMNLNQTSRSLFALLTINEAAVVYGSHFFNFDRVHSVPITVPIASDVPGEITAFERWCAKLADPTVPAPTVKNADGYYEDNYAPCGNDDPLDVPGDGIPPNPQFNFVRRLAAINLDGDERLNFRTSSVNSPSYARDGCQGDMASVPCNTDFVKVYHPHPDTWILKSELPAQAARLAWGGGRNGYVFKEYQQVPLEITITRR